MATFNTNSLTAPAPPTLLNYWRGSHYGGSVCSMDRVLSGFLACLDARGASPASAPCAPSTERL